MYSWNQFINQSNVSQLSISEQHRQYFIYQSDMIYEKKRVKNVTIVRDPVGGRIRRIDYSISEYVDDYVDDYFE
jgi:hypothetical protein